MDAEESTRQELEVELQQCDASNVLKQHAAKKGKKTNEHRASSASSF
jgi:hypothetical protein